MLLTRLQEQPPPEGDDSAHKKDEQGEDKKQKENTAYAKKMVLRLAGIMGLGGTVGIVYIFGEFACCFLMLRLGTRGLEFYKLEDFLSTSLDYSKRHVLDYFFNYWIIVWIILDHHEDIGMELFL